MSIKILIAIIAAILILLVLGGALLGLSWGRQFRQAAPQPAAPRVQDRTIDAWLWTNNLNQYGDPQGTVYLGGTPLFNESTGKTQDRYDYILEKYPDRPWLK